jgi:hypothetical protein
MALGTRKVWPRADAAPSVVNGENDPWSNGYVHGKQGKPPESKHQEYVSGHKYGTREKDVSQKK